MKYYATLLNLNEAKECSLEEHELSDPLMQDTLLDQVLCGSGETEDAALQNAIDNLVDEGILEICKCEGGVREVITKIPGKQALRHLWLSHDEYHDEYRLNLMPFHDHLVDFCERHDLAEDARLELETMFDAAMN
jgi:hypothetical protein